MIAVARVSRLLVKLRGRWLNPPEWVGWVDEPAAGYPMRAVPTKGDPVRELGRRTLTNLYNERPWWLVDAHRALDAAVAKPYCWTADISETSALRELLELNSTRD